MVKINTSRLGPTSSFGISAGGFVYGTGGTVTWWEKYDLAAAHFQQHGNLDEFDDRVWMKEVRTQRQNEKLSPDQLYFLSRIHFDFTPRKAGGRKVGNRLSKAVQLKAIFDEKGKEGLTGDQRNDLLRDLKFYHLRYNSGHLSEGSARRLGVDDVGTYRETLAALRHS